MTPSVDRTVRTSSVRLRRGARARGVGGFPGVTARRISERTAALVLALGLLAACAPPAETVPNYLGMNLHGDRIEWVWDSEAATWTAWNRDLDVELTGEFAASTESSLEGFVETDGDEGTAWAVEHPGIGLVANFPSGRGDGSVSWAASTSVSVEDYRSLMLGNHSCVRLRTEADNTQDMAFLTLTEDTFALDLVDSSTTRPENLPFGASTIDPGEGDLEGSWSLGGLNDQEILLEAPGGDWEGVIYPGFAIFLKAPDLSGLIGCLWSPLPNTQLSVYDGDFRFIEYRKTEDGFGPPGLGTVDIFGEAGELYRRSASGVEETATLGLRTQVYFVGNLVLWEITEDERIYMGVASEFYIQWTQQGGPGGPNAPDGDMISFAIGFHPRDSHLAD